ncbi:hypothetical protein [Opitutus terrae]|uniref:hypothetical protein n=1 Tax=Opitutus terrae TaxID=107709 RepID=UPI0006939680|nr:hypothetical protein [Opitutus terrae]
MISAIACGTWWGEIVEFHNDIRGYLFSGFLTLGSFLLTTKTFVITRLQEGLFQKREYDEWYRIAVQQHGVEKVGARNQPLRNLTEFLVWSVVSCLGTAVCQLLLSAVKHPFATTVAFGASAGALSLVLRAWWHLRALMLDYLDYANREKVEG